MWWCQFIDWLNIETRPSSLRNSGMANSNKVLLTRFNSTNAVLALMLIVFVNQSNRA